MDQNSVLRILMLEDSVTDAEINARALRAAGIAFTSLRVEDRDGFAAALRDFAPDLVLLDCNLPHYDGRSALALLRGDHPEVPAIFVTGALGDEAAVDLLKAGAADYVIKDRLARLGPAVRSALEQEWQRREQRQVEYALQSSELHYRSLFTNLLDGFAHCRMLGAEDNPEDFEFLEMNEAFFPCPDWRLAQASV